MIQFTDINGDTVYIRREAVDEVRQEYERRSWQDLGMERPATWAAFANTISTIKYFHVAGYSKLFGLSGVTWTVLGTPEEVAAKLQQGHVPVVIRCRRMDGHYTAQINNGPFHSGTSISGAIVNAIYSCIEVKWLEDEV